MIDPNPTVLVADSARRSWANAISAGLVRQQERIVDNLWYGLETVVLARNLTDPRAAPCKYEKVIAPRRCRTLGEGKQAQFTNSNIASFRGFKA